MKKNITVLGGGPVGTLLSLMLARKGHSIHLYEKRPDIRQGCAGQHRSINLALSERGWRALELVGVKESVQQCAIPMAGRLIHAPAGDLSFQSYGRPDQSIFSISRRQINHILLDAAGQDANIALRFEHECLSVDAALPEVTVRDNRTGTLLQKPSDAVFGADGAFSMVQSGLRASAASFARRARPLAHGYKELTVPAAPGGGWAMEKNALHIWPRNTFMLIALPNLDGSFTATLFLPQSGSPSFASLQTVAQVTRFFETEFPDLLATAPGIIADYLNNPVSALGTSQCYPWSYKGNVLLIGDAAHCIVPFYGQGMNLGFEDCSVLHTMLEESPGDWAALFNAFQKVRKPNADAIGNLAMRNFIEMRDKVADPQFLLRKEIESHLGQYYPELWTPLYTLIAFTHTPFVEALRVGKRQDRILDRILRMTDIETTWQTLNYRAILDASRQAATV